MTNLLIVVVVLMVANIGISCAIFMHMMMRFDLLEMVLELRPKKNNTVAGVTRAAPEFTNPRAASDDDSAIVEPKTPQRIAFEEEQELRKMNLGPK